MDKRISTFEKVIGNKICTAEEPPRTLSSRLNSIKVLTTASTSGVRDVYLSLTNLIESTSVPKFGPSQKYFSSKNSERQPFIIGFQGVCCWEIDH